MGYQLTKRLHLEEIGCMMSQLLHEESGAKVLHLGNDDPENLFCLAFQTLPRRSDGAPHILEHTVLCGSRKYPVKDPFFGMTRRSLNTFMNAMTGDDLTFYPAATLVPKDFYNLLDVYIDAVFFPNLKRLSFLQEGHRLEFLQPEDPTSRLLRKGIVYNEMKGAMASADARSWYHLVSALYPDTPYRFNSGGDPKEISLLTYEELRNFHATFYHPSRCLFFFYGNLPLERHLEFLQDRILGDAERLPPLPPIPTQPRLSRPVTLSASFPTSAEEEDGDDSMVVFGWLTTEASRPEEVLSLYILDLLLMGTDASPLKLALLKSGLCKDAYAFVAGDMADVPLVLTCKGTKPEDAQALEDLLRNELERLARHPFSKEQIDAAIHQLEFSRLEIKGDSAPYGLSLFRRSGPLLLLGVEPEAGLKIHTLFNKLRKRFEDPAATGHLIRDYLLANRHLVRLTMIPDQGLSAREDAEEMERLKVLQQSLSSAQTEEIVKQAAELASFQGQEEPNLETLPRVTLADVAKDPQNFPLDQSFAGPFELYHHPCFTNGILYTGLHFDLPSIAEEEFLYLQLLTSMLPEVGAGGRDYRAQLDYLMAHTGGVSATASVNPHISGLDRFSPTFTLGGKALDQKVPHLFPLFVDMLSSADFDDTARIGELLGQYTSSLEHSLPSHAMRYAIGLATAPLSIGSAIGNAWQGLPFFLSMRELKTKLKTKIPKVQHHLKALQERILGAGRPHLVIGCDQSAFHRHTEHRLYGLLDMPVRTAPVWQVPTLSPPAHSHGRIIASSVAFTCKAVRAPSFTHPDSAALSLAARLFDHLTLHPEVREKGGAYGTGAVNSSSSGIFYFYSYRDPHLASTLEAFQRAVDRVSRGEFNDDHLEQAKLSYIQKVDSPFSPGSRAGAAYGWLKEGKTFEIRQAFRKRLLSLTCEEIAQAVLTHLSPAFHDGIVISFAGEELLRHEQPRLRFPFDLLSV